MSKAKKPQAEPPAAKRVLVVEDSPTQAQALGAALEAAGYGVVIATSGDEALHQLQPNGFDVVVSDIVMPGEVDGYELCRRIKSGPLREIPVVLFTSLADPLDIIHGLECGADNFFTKSHGTEHLLQRIKVLLETKQARAQGRVRLGVKVFFLGREFTITSDREQIIDLLMSTFEDAVFQNRELLLRESELARSHQSLHGLYQLAVGLNQVTSEAQVLDTALDRALELPGVQAGWMWLRNGESGFRVAATRNLPPALQEPGAMDGDCLCRRRLLSGDLDSVTNILECERLQRAKGDTRGLRYHATIPLWVGDRTMGVMNLVGADQGLFSDQDLKILFGVGNEIAVALERAQLQAGLEHLVEERTAALSAEIAERTRSEELLRASEERYRMLFERSPLPIWVVDVETLAFLAVNPAAVEHYGYSEAEFLSMTAKDIRPPEDVPALLASFSARHLPQFRSSQWRHRKKDGTLMDVEIAAHTLEFHGRLAQMVVVNDITERKRAEEALRQSHERFQQLADNIKEVFFVIDQGTGEALYVSPAYERVMGRSCESAYGAPFAWAEAVHPDDRERVRAATVAATKRELFEDVFRIIRPNGQVRWVRSRTSPVPDPSGEVHRIVGVAEDVTELRQTEQQLLQAQKMEAVGQLAGGVAHDFNNILTVIGGYVDFLLTDLGPQDPRRADVQEIATAAKRAADLTRQLLLFGRRQVLQPSVLDLNKVIGDIEKMLRRLIGEDIELVTVLDRELGAVKVDPGQIEQVLMNLSVNARDAMPTGGKLTIQTANVELDEEYARTHPEVSPGQHVMLAVSDTGVGMSAEVRQHIFEPFFTTKEKGKGTGLGLATVYAVVKESKGSIWIYSEPGAGATFKIYLPRVDEAVITVKSAEAPTALQGTETVLLVEDEPAVRGVARKSLSRHGYTVLEAADPETALRLARANRPIHLVLTDVVMPGMSGRELAEDLVTLVPGIKVLYMSGYTDDAVVRHGVLESGTPFIQKPFRAEILLRKVREVLDS
ncbi:MAG: response regulator [Gemmatimonadetes bacterium]|nr:response regulator [Gemmatimonadota bacterium]